MGGALAVRLAERENIDGAFLVNPSLGSDEIKYKFAELGALLCRI
ncbi:hypothetical protein J2S70_000414 [Trueperella bonasi]|uniref:Uncharacterized protein n=1 Tax=Trueperella bonasi TaxID=312286 RepID=A0ABT9NEM2_9ACTO|nr:hypothetical protein [Trueperella bonasi]